MSDFRSATSLPRYVGGKHGRTGAWIASQLPADAEIYGEPFAGLAGVLLQRQPAPLEILNDLDGDIIAWWRGVRDHCDALERWCAATPWSRRQWIDSYDALRDGVDDPVERAGHVWVVLWQSFAPQLGSRSGWRLGRNGSPCARIRAPLAPLAARMSLVALEERDAAAMINERDVRGALLYCDPPYDGTDGYGASADDAWLTAVLGAQEARIAVSGYRGATGDRLTAAGWHETTLDTLVSIRVDHDSRQRTECLWTNYEPLQQRLF